jgi:2-haloacid dehalogenase
VRYKWLLFDADGTLFDYDKSEAGALTRTFEQFGWRLVPEYAHTYRQINAQVWKDFEQGKVSQKRLRTKRFELFFEAVHLDADPVLFSKRYLENLAERTDLVDGAEGVVGLLHGKVGLAIVTNGLSDVQRPRLANSAIGNCFAEFVISEEVGVAKPDPRFFDVVFERVGWPAKEVVLVVGDSLTSDIKGGNNYGLDTCWFNPGHEPRALDVQIEYEISCLGELLDVVEVGQAEFCR